MADEYGGESHDNFIFQVVRILGTAFDFQLFNLYSKTEASGSKSKLSGLDRQYVPSTVFVAADHLSNVILGDLVPRSCANHQLKIEQAFVESVWVLHAKLFRAYSNWAVKQVDLPTRPREDQHIMDLNYSDDEVVKVLMAEIALYMLIYTEAANLRHMPEFISLLFWTMRFSPSFAAATSMMQPLSEFTSREAGVSLRMEYEMARNECAVIVDELTSAVATGQLNGAWGAVEAEVRTRVDAPVETLDTVVDLILHGDGGSFLDTVVQPMFLLLSYLEDRLGGSKHDTSTRLTYDDCNDSLCYPAVVKRAIALLGAHDPLHYNVAFQALQRMGRSADGKSFDPRIPAQWWEREVFQKVFVERRGWLHVYRNNAATLTTFLMVIQAVLVFTFVAFNFNEQNMCRHPEKDDCPAFGVDASSCRWCVDLCWIGWSSLALSHCALSVLHKWANWYLSRQPAVAPPLSSLPLDSILLKTAWRLDEVTLGAANRPLPPNIPIVRVERDGHTPLAALHYIFGLLLMVFIFFAQFNPGNFGYVMSKLWIATGSLYALFWLLRVLIVVRDGYNRPLGPTCINMVCPADAQVCGTSSDKTDAEERKKLKVGWHSFSRNTLLWVVTLTATLLAIYCEAYNIVRWIVTWALKGYTVEERGPWVVGTYNTGLPKPGNQIVVALMMLVTAVISVMPFMTFIDIVAGTQLLSSMIGVRHGFNAAKNWSQFAKLFDSAAELFCFKCLPRSVAVSREPVKSFSVVWNAVVMDYWSRDMLSLSEALNLSYLEVPDNELTAAMDLPEVFPPPFSLGPHLTAKIQAPYLPFLTPKQSVTRDASKILSLIMWILADLDLLTTEQAAEISRLMAAAADERTTRTRVNNLTTLALEWARHIAPALPDAMPNAHVNARPDVAVASSIASSIPSLLSQDLGPSSGLRPLSGSMQGSLTNKNQLVRQSLDCGLTETVLLAPVGRTGSITGSRVGSFSRPGSMTAGKMDSFTRAGSMTGGKMNSFTRAGSRTGPTPGPAAGVRIAASRGPGELVPPAAPRPKGPGEVGAKHDAHRVDVPGGLEGVLRELRNCLGDWQRQTEYGQLSRALFKELDAALQAACTSSSLSRAHSQLTSANTTTPTLISTIRYLGCVASCTTWAGSEPRSKEAEWLLRLFMKSLHNPKLGRKPACHVATMPSLTTLIPLYNEDISMAYDAAEATVAMMASKNMSQLTAKDVSGNQVVTLPEVPKVDPRAPKDTSRAWYGCMEEIEQGVSQQSYLVRTYNLDWDNFRTRMALVYHLRREDVHAEAFASGAPLHHLQQEFCEWVSGRSQMLSRHIRGLQCSAVATRVLLRLECPKPEAWSDEDYEHWVEAVVGRKYQTLVAAQTLGDKLRSSKSRDQYNAKGLLYLLNRYPFMQAAMLKNEHGTVNGRYTRQYSVVIRGRSYFACPEVAPDEHAIAAMSLYRGSVLQQDLDDYEVEYCIRLPVNVFSARGVIIGEGKAENHNSAMPYITSELLQGNDMNMDNILSEAFKLRNLVSDAMARDPLARMFPRLRAFRAEEQREDDDDGIVNTPQLAVPKGTCAKDLNYLLQMTLSGPQLAIIGMTSWICTSYTGPVAALNNYLEIIFVFNIQRYMQYASRVRYHYGYADVWNKFWAMTTTGLSRPVRNVNVVEDLTVGVRVALKGGVIKHRDYIMSGKGRETNLMGIYSYHRKIGAGVMEATFGRDFFRLHKVHDLFRQSTSYMFMNNTCVTMHLVFAAAMARLLTYYIVTLFDMDTTPSPARTMMAIMPSWFPQIQYMSEFYLFLTLFWASFLVLVLFGPEEYIQNGWKGLFQMFLNLTVRGYVMFSMLILKIWEYFGTSATKYMAGKYIATGRGLGLHHIQFPQLFIYWGRGFWTYSAVITTMAMAHHFNPSTSISPAALPWYASSITFPLLLGAFLIIGPSWFSPLSFHPRKVATGAADWFRWMWFGVRDRGTGLTWHEFNNERAGHLYGQVQQDSRVADYWITWLGCVLVLALRASITALYSIKLVLLFMRTEMAGSPRLPAVSGLGSLPRQLDDLAFGWLPAGQPHIKAGYWEEVANLSGRTAVFWGIMLLVVGPIHQLILRSRLRDSGAVKAVAMLLYHTVVPLLFAQVHYRYVANGYVARCLFLLGVWHLNAGELLALVAIPTPLWVVRHAVTQAYWLGDYLLGSGVLALHGVLALPMVVHWVQTALIFTHSGYQQGC